MKPNNTEPVSTIREILFLLWRSGRNNENKYISINEAEAQFQRICASERLTELTTVRDIDGNTVDAWASPAHQYILDSIERLQTLIEETPNE